jgi:antitoxin (DNA-binding transcriptional repressor) of toxin-antitoxin stability system
MQTTSLQEAQTHLAMLISQLQPGEELVITEQDQPVARLVAERREKPKTRQPGSAIGKLTIIEDDDAHLEDFREYMQ